jgi:hypothetical protein
MPVVKDDLHHITAEYLIDNIEAAFRSWQEAPWGKHVAFDVFCEEILPYRIAGEPLENWREYALASFADVYRSLLNSDSMTAVEACGKVNEKLPSFIHGKHFPSMSYRQLMASTRGTQEQQSILADFVMRAMGIPVVSDGVLQSFNSRYAWNAVCDSTGKHIPFIAKEQPPGHRIPEDDDDRITAKAFRRTFRRQYATDSLSGIPHLLENRQDVSSEYGNVINFNISVPVDIDTGVQMPEYACLATIGSLSEWIPVCLGKYHNGTYQFASLGVNMLYLPVIYKNGRQIPFGRPFFLTDEGKVIYFERSEQVSPETSYPHWLNARYKTENTTMRDNLSGWWLFEDTINYGKATAGKDLMAYRMPQKKHKGQPSGNTGLKQTEGPKPGKKAVRIPRFTYLKCMHGVSHNGTGKNINEYTIMVDFKLPNQNCYCLLQTNPDNSDDVDIYLYGDFGRIGVARLYCLLDTPLRENEWYRFVVSARLGQSLKYYLNGELILANYNTKLGVLDSRLSWSKEAVLLFADDDGEDNDMDVSEVAIFDRALVDEEVFALGSAGNEWNTVKCAE